MLAEAGFLFDKIVINESDDFEKIIEKILLQLNFKKIPVTLGDNFNNYTLVDIKNKIITIHPGVILGIFKPSGGNLRKMLQEIINKEEVDAILDSEPNKNIYKNRIDQFILEKSSELLRIQASNYAQDKALISALNQNTIIWGPPGTGKSQVIANIIANVFNAGKSAIVMSQKKRH